MKSIIEWTNNAINNKEIQIQANIELAINHLT